MALFPFLFLIVLNVCHLYKLLGKHSQETTHILIKLLYREELQPIARGCFIAYFEETSRFLLTNRETENSRDTSYFLNDVIILVGLDQEMPALVSLGMDVF